MNLPAAVPRHLIQPHMLAIILPQDIDLPPVARLYFASVEFLIFEKKSFEIMRERPHGINLSVRNARGSLNCGKARKEGGSFRDLL